MRFVGRSARLFVALAPLVLALAAAAAPQRGAREYNFNGEPLESAVGRLAADLCMGVEYDEAARAHARAARINFRVANTTPASALVRLLESQQLRYDSDGRGVVLVSRHDSPRQQPAAGRLRVINYNGDLEFLVLKLAEEAGLNVDRERARAVLPRRNVAFEAWDTSAWRALQMLLARQGFTYEREGCGPAVIVKDETIFVR